MTTATTVSAPAEAADSLAEANETVGYGALLSPTVIVSALGYFVDMFDLTLFGVVRVSSLKGIGITDPAQLLDTGVLLVNLQMIGMLIGGVIWGVMGDKRGRLSVLFGSILLYSGANIANSFVTSVEAYAVLRFLAGIGLAGELGAAITLVSESLPPRLRGFGTTIVATCGLMGAVAAALFGQKFSWQNAYLFGGCLGIALLIARFSVFESGMFARTTHANVKRGDLRMLFTGARGLRYVRCICLGIPIWFASGVLMFFAPEITSKMGFATPVSAGSALLYYTIGLTVGDLASGLLSQWLRSRNRALAAFLGAGTLLVSAFAMSGAFSTTVFYSICFLIGVSAGYWAVFITVAAEQFGTNLRATVATTVPNFVRGSVVVLTLSFTTLKNYFPVLQSAMIVGAACYALAFWALVGLPETYGKDLEFVEE